MTVDVKKRVDKEAENAPNSIKKLVFDIIDELEKANSLSDVKNVRPMEGTDEPYYRITLRSYRLLLYYEKEKKNVKVLALLNRQESYKKENLPWHKK